MTDEFQKGLITGLAMQPLQVTTEHAEADPSSSSTGSLIIGDFVNATKTTILGEVIVIDIPTTEGA